MSNLSLTPPQATPYQYSEDDTLEVFRAFQRGESGCATRAVVDALMTGLDIAVYDMDNLDRMAQWYGPVFSAGETLIAALTNHPGGKLAVSAEMGLFAELAMKHLAQASPPQKPTADQRSALDKLIAAAKATANGKSEVDLGQLDAKNLGNFLQAGMRLVVPGDLKPEALSSQADAVKQQYNQQVSDMPDRFRRAFGMR